MSFYLKEKNGFMMVKSHCCIVFSSFFPLNYVINFPSHTYIYIFLSSTSSTSASPSVENHVTKSLMY